MKNIAIIFAGGSGSRMKTVSKPKQFLELNGKPVIIYTLELFDNHPEIDGIVVVCIEPWISFLMNAAVNCLRRKNVVIHWYVFAKKMVVTNVIPITISNVACVNSMR